MAMGSGCPYRAGNRVISDVNDIATVYLNLVASSDYENNKGMAPKQMKAKTTQSYGKSVQRVRAQNILLPV